MSNKIVWHNRLFNLGTCYSVCSVFKSVEEFGELLYIADWGGFQKISEHPHKYLN